MLGTLKEVAINIKSLYPGAEIVICADNDASGVGEKKAREAALVYWRQVHHAVRNR